MQITSFRYPKILWQALLAITFIYLLPQALCAQVKTDTVYYNGNKNIQSITQTEGHRKKTTNFYQNGNKRSVAEYLNNKMDGEQIKWNENGVKEQDVHYKEDNMDGKYESWYPSGLLQYSKNYHLVTDSVGIHHSYLEGDFLENYSNGQIKEKRKYHDNKKEGFWQEWYDNGIKKSRGTYQHCVVAGKFKFWYKSGQLNIEATYKAVYDSLRKKYEQKTDGNYKEYGENGHLLAKGKFKNGKKEGRYQEWYVNGISKSDCEYKEGRIYGHNMTWFDNGKPSFDYYSYQELNSKGRVIDRYENNYLCYYQSGQIKETGHYTGGKKDGEWKNYYENGVLSSLRSYIDGVQTGLSEQWYRNNQVSQKENYQRIVYKKDSAVSVKEGIYEYYYENGNIQEKGMLHNNQKNGIWESYFKDGKISNSVLYNNGAIVGTNQSWFENGKIKSKSNFAKSPDSSGIKLHGPQYSYYPNGSLEKCVNMYYGMLMGAQKEFYFNGSLKNYTIVLKGEKETYRTDGDRLIFTFFENGQLRSLGFTMSSRNFGPTVNIFMDGKIRIIEDGNINVTNNTVATWFPDGKYKAGEINIPEKKEKIELTEKDAAKLLEHFKYVLDPVNFPDSNFTGHWRFPAQGDLVLFEANFKNGMLQGDFKSYYGDGKVAVSEYFEAGIIDGPYSLYFDNGNVYMKGTYAHGLQTGIWEEYGNKGFKAREYAFDSKGQKKIWTKDYYENSTQIQNYYDNVQSENNKSWYKNGIPISERTVLDSAGKHYRISHYFENGRKHYEEEYLSSKRHGTTTYYYDNGQTEFECHYINDQQNGSFIRYYKNGKVLAKGQLIMSVKEGAWQSYDSTGKMKETFYAKGHEKVGPSPLACFCAGSDEKDPSFAPLLRQFTDLETVRKWSFKFHAPIDNFYNDLFYSNLQFSGGRDASFYSLDILAYKEIWLRIPDERGFKLILNYCGAGKKLTRTHLSANINQNDKTQTSIFLEGGRMAIEFSPKLLVQDLPDEIKDEKKNDGQINTPIEKKKIKGKKDDKIINSVPEEVISPVEENVQRRGNAYRDATGDANAVNFSGYDMKNKVPSLYTFNCKDLVYDEKNGIVPGYISDPCFPPSVITGTGILLSFKNASVDLNAFKGIDDYGHSHITSYKDSLYKAMAPKKDFSASQQFTGLSVDSAQLQIPLNGIDKRIRIAAKAYDMHISNLEMNGLIIIKAEKDNDIYTMGAAKDKTTESKISLQFKAMGCSDLVTAYLPGRKELAIFFHIKR